MSDTKPKKRGRPKKTDVTKKIVKNNQEDHEIILRLKTFSDDNYSSDSDSESECESNSDENNFFTINETTEGCTKHNMKYGADDNCESDNDITVDDLYKELKDKERLIKKLTDKVNYMSTCGTYSANTATKDVVKHLHNLKLLDVNNLTAIKISDNTQIKCWNCTHNFNGPPFFIPDSYINGYFYVFGCFCSLNCAATYNLHILNDSRTKTRHSLILIIFHKIFGTHNKLVYAPRKELLEDYGGLITIDEYRKSFMTINKEHSMKIPPMLPLVYEIETKTSDNAETLVMPS